MTNPQGPTQRRAGGTIGAGDERGERGGERGDRAGQLGPAVRCQSTWGLNPGLGHNYQGLLTRVTDPAGQAWAVVYDEADLPMWRERRAGGERDEAGLTGWGGSGFRYNGHGHGGAKRLFGARQLAQLAGCGNRSQYGYDGAGRLAAVTDANWRGDADVVHDRSGSDEPDRRAEQHKSWRYDMYGREVAETERERGVGEDERV